MIRNEKEYKQAVTRLTEEKKRLADQRKELKGLDLSKEEIKRVLDPLRSFQAQLNEEIQSYERLKRGQFDELQNFEGIGRLLIALRISRNVSQRELSERLEVDESQVSRDERNEYHGITTERANRILNALGARLRTVVDTVSDKPAPAQ